MARRPGSGLPAPAEALIKLIRNIRDKTAALQREVERLNAVDPDFSRLEKAKEKMLTEINKATIWIDEATSKSQTRDDQRRELTLEVAYGALEDIKAGLSNPFLNDRRIEAMLEKDASMIRRAYNTMPDLCSMTPKAVSILRNSWVYTGTTLCRAATMKYRHVQACELLEKFLKGHIDYYDTYYFARLLNTARCFGENYKYDLCLHRIFEIANIWDIFAEDAKKVLANVLKYQSSIALHTLSKRNDLRDIISMLAEEADDLEHKIAEQLRWRPPLPWAGINMPEIDPYDTELMD